MFKTLALASLIALVSSLPALGATAILAGGCFWCVESDFEKLEGVTDAVSGFTGGTAENPTYNGDHSGHYEAVKITYDPAMIDYEGILRHFWTHHDPFDPRGQFCDKGHEYLAAIFVANDEERAIAEQTRSKVQSLFPDMQVVTPVLNQSDFYPIKGDEEYHQDYYKKYPLRYQYYRFSCGRDRRVAEIWEDKNLD